MIATRALAAPAWDRVELTFTDDNGHATSIELNRSKAVALAHEMLEVADGFTGNEVVARWAIGPTTPVTSKPGTGYSEIQWGSGTGTALGCILPVCATWRTYCTTLPTRPKDNDMRIDGFTPLRIRGNRVETFLILAGTRIHTTISKAKARDLADAICRTIDKDETR